MQHSALLSAIFICSRFDLVCSHALLKYICFITYIMYCSCVVDERYVPLFPISRLYIRFSFFSPVFLEVKLVASDL